MKSKKPFLEKLVLICALLLLLSGIVLMIVTFKNANEALSEERSRHLLDIARATDRNVATVQNRTLDELNYAIIRNESRELAYLQTGDEQEMLAHLRSLPVLQADYASMILIMRDSEILLCSNGGSADDFSFPYGISMDRPCICQNTEGENYFAVVQNSPYSELQYAVLIDLNVFYRYAAGIALTDDYWLLLYDAGSGVYLQNDPEQQETKRLSAEEVLERQDGITIAAEAERINNVILREYTFEGNEQLFAVLPSGKNSNGVFCIGVAVNNHHFLHMNARFFLNIAICLLLLAAGIGAFLLLQIQSRISIRTTKKQLRLLKEKNATEEQLLDNTQKLAHHQRLELIGTMTSGIAHEFNNLLTPIMGYSILSLENLPEGAEELSDNLTEIYTASKRAKKLIANLSELTRTPEPPHHTLCVPDSLLHQALELSMPAKPEEVAVNFGQACTDPCLVVNSDQIVQTLLNLILNAFQAMAGMEGTLTLESADLGQEIEFIIKDTGIGMDEETCAHIFEPFFTTKERGKGTGLGLAITAQTIESHNGSIRVESSIGVGTAFYVLLPKNPER